MKSTAVETATNAIVVGDHDGKIVWANPAFSQLTGYPLAEAVGQRIWFLKSTGDQSQLLQELWDAIMRGRVWRGKFRNCRKDGASYVEEMTLTPVRSGTGQITNYVAIKQEVPAPPSVRQPSSAEALVANT